MKMQQLVDNRYRIQRPLGSGGMAEVYLAHDDVLDRNVALKVMSRRYADDDEFVERFKREAQSAAALSHPNIVSIFDRGESEDGTYYIAMEYLPGGTLKDRILKKGALPPRTAAAVTLQIAEALRAAHRAGVIHRDIKPHNVLITDDGDVKVVDFGIARAASSSTMTKTGSILGTAHYISPEQAMGEPVGPQSDLYSLGVVLYEMLAGELPYDAETPLGIAMKHVNGHLKQPKEINPAVPGGINAIAVRLLAKNPGDRYGSTNELIEDLERVLDGLDPKEETTRVMHRVPAAAAASPTLISPPRRTEREEDKGKRSPWAIPLLVLLLLALLGGVGYALYPVLAPTPTAPAPDLVGAESLEAAQQLAGDQFTVVEGSREPSEEPVGTIVGQDPEAGGEAAVGSEIQVVISDPQVAEVPDVSGQTRAEAEAALSDAGFEVTAEERESSREDDGRVIDQDPAAEERAEVGSTVTITVGTGPSTIEVPDLTGQTPQQAAATLSEYELEIGEQSYGPSDSAPEGTIIDQNPAGGTSVAPSTVINVTVSSGPEPVEVPDVAGQDWIRASRELQAAGLTVNQKVTQIPSNRPRNQVLRTDPAAGTEVEPGTVVTLVTSAGRPQQDDSNGGQSPDDDNNNDNDNNNSGPDYQSPGREDGSSSGGRRSGDD